VGEPVLAHIKPVERRHCPRRTPDAAEPLTRMRLRAGRDLRVLDVSDSGALVEGVSRLLPGTRVDVHVVPHGGRVLLRSRVVRSFVNSVDADGVTYRSGLAFEQRVDTAASVPVVIEVADERLSA
jgi:hypothetical protein